MMVREIKNRIRKIVYSVIEPPFVPMPPASYSQAGEDAVLSFLFTDYGKSRIEYLDLGTNIPDYGNNTYKFYRNGSRGVCVEANASLIENIKKIRPEDVIINAGVSPESNGEADFYIFDIPAISTFDKKEAEYRVSQGIRKIVKTVRVPLITINDLIKNNFSIFPDLLSIDIEGFDLGVLKTLDFITYPVPVIVVETCTYSENHVRPKDRSIIDFMLTKDYEVYADTYVNTIFVNKNWFYK
jgi:FkbM family methyltransferase